MRLDFTFAFLLFTFAFIMFWQTSRRKFDLTRPLIMAILNVTPDSFSDGGEFLSPNDALKQAEKLVTEGADIIDIGGESTRPGSNRVSVPEEISRVIPIIEAITKRFDIPISVDTTKSMVAERAVDGGAEIINDISGLRFDEKIAEIAAGYNAGLILMHSRGNFETMHTQQPVDNILREVASGFRTSLATANAFGVKTENIALDPGIGFGKTFAQNLELIAKLDRLVDEFPNYSMVVGTSRKSFIGKIQGSGPAGERLSGSLASAIIAVWNGVRIVRVHDVKKTVDAIKITDAIRRERNI